MVRLRTSNGTVQPDNMFEFVKLVYMQQTLVKHAFMQHAYAETSIVQSCLLRLEL